MMHEQGANDLLSIKAVELVNKVSAEIHEIEDLDTIDHRRVLLAQVDLLAAFTRLQAVQRDVMWHTLRFDALDELKDEMGLSDE